MFSTNFRGTKQLIHLWKAAKKSSLPRFATIPPELPWHHSDCKYDRTSAPPWQSRPQLVIWWIFYWLVVEPTLSDKYARQMGNHLPQVSRGENCCDTSQVTTPLNGFQNITNTLIIANPPPSNSSMGSVSWPMMKNTGPTHWVPRVYIAVETEKGVGFSRLIFAASAGGSTIRSDEILFSKKLSFPLRSF